MDTGHLHLMLNHLPVLGVPALLALLVWGLARNMPSVARGALWLTLALSAVTAAVYLTGEAAEELVEGLPTFDERLVERHDLENHDALAYIEERLKAMGVVKQLESRGFQPGDEVEIGEVAFALYPGIPQE